MTNTKAFFTCFLSPAIVIILWSLLDVFYGDAYISIILPLVFLAFSLFFILRFVQHRFKSTLITIVSTIIFVILFSISAWVLFALSGFLSFHPALAIMIFYASLFIPILVICIKYGKEFLKPSALGLISSLVLFFILYGFSQSVYDIFYYNII